jgi:hypothetical protein
MLAKYVISDGISQAFLRFRFVDVIVITDHLPFCDQWRALVFIFPVKSAIC